MCFFFICEGYVCNTTFDSSCSSTSVCLIFGVKCFSVFVCGNKETIIESDNEVLELMGRVDEGVEEFFTKRVLPTDSP